MNIYQENHQIIQIRTFFFFSEPDVRPLPVHHWLMTTKSISQVINGSQLTVKKTLDNKYSIKFPLSRGLSIL